MATATIFEAKTNLSALVKKIQAGETVIITSARSKIPVAKLAPIEPVQPKTRKRLGLMYDPNFLLGDAFWEPLPPGWDGVSDPERVSCSIHTHLSGLVSRQKKSVSPPPVPSPIQQVKSLSL